MRKKIKIQRRNFYIKLVIFFLLFLVWAISFVYMENQRVKIVETTIEIDSD
mgnify:CR=1 FL=1